MGRVLTGILLTSKVQGLTSDKKCDVSEDSNVAFAQTDYAQCCCWAPLYLGIYQANFQLGMLHSKGKEVLCMPT